MLPWVQVFFLVLTQMEIVTGTDTYKIQSVKRQLNLVSVIDRSIQLFA